MRGDTEFNESFAVAVEEAGLARWLAAHGDAAQRAEAAAMQARRADFLDLVGRYRARLAAAYAAPLDRDEKLAAKRRILADLEDEYHRLRAGRWHGFAGYDRWFGGSINNATLASVGLYHDLVPAFRRLLAADGGDLQRFYGDVRTLAALSKEQRRQGLAEGIAPHRAALGAAP